MRSEDAPMVNLSRLASLVDLVLERGVGRIWLDYRRIILGTEKAAIAEGAAKRMAKVLGVEAEHHPDHKWYSVGDAINIFYLKD